MVKESGRASARAKESKEKDESEENISTVRSSIAAFSFSIDTPSPSSPFSPVVAQEVKAKRTANIKIPRYFHIYLEYFLLSRWSTLLSTSRKVGSEFSHTVFLPCSNGTYTYTQFLCNGLGFLLGMVQYSEGCSYHIEFFSIQHTQSLFKNGYGLHLLIFFLYIRGGRYGFRQRPASIV